MEIIRPDLISELQGYVLRGNGLIVGPPGVGKTHSIRGLLDTLQAQGKVALFLPIDRLGNGTIEDLEMILGIQTSLVDKLRMEGAAIKDKPGVIFFDGFDSARNVESKKRFLEIIRQTLELREYWNIIVSVRTYDAQKSRELLNLFGPNIDADSKDYFDASISCRNFLIPFLNQSEIDQAVLQIRGFKPIYDQSSSDFRDLLRTPFNFWLLNEISDFPQVFSLVNEMGSAVQLLKLYWRERITKNTDADAREIILTQAARSMVEARTLSIRKESIYDANLDATWHALQSDNVLVADHQRVGFSHNILFDFAVSILLLEDEPSFIEKHLAGNLAQTLFLLPSLDFYFTRIWYDSRDLFWKSLLYLLNSPTQHIKLLSRITLPSVISREVRSLGDLKRLIETPPESDEQINTIILYLLQAIRALTIIRDELWASFLESLCPRLSQVYIWDLALLLGQILDRLSKDNQRAIFESIGRTSRTILGWLLEHRKVSSAEWSDALGSNMVLPLVIKTYETDLTSSRSLLTQVMELMRIENYPINYLYRLTDQMNQIWPSDPEFVYLIYTTLSGHQETSSADTQFGGTVLSFTSNRRQDFSMCLYQLTWKFKEFLRAQPETAYSAGIEAINAFIYQKHIKPIANKDQSSIAESFSIRGKSVKYLPDYSYMWNQGVVREEMLQIADEIFAHLEQLRSANNLDEMDSFLEIYIEHASVGYLWARLIDFASEFPDTFAPRLHDLFLAIPILSNNETLYQAGKFLEVASPSYSTDQLKQIELAILSLPDYQRKRLIARLPYKSLVSEEARSVRETMEKENNFPENEPLVSMTSWSKAYTTEDFLMERGVNHSDKENADFVELFDQFDRFAKTWQNSIPSSEALAEILPIARKMYDKLSIPSGASKDVINLAWTKLGDVIAIISRRGKDLQADEFSFASSVMLACAGNKLPEVEQVTGEDSDFIGWSPSPRHAAAQGLTWLAMKSPDDQIIKAISALVHDPVSSVSYLALIDIWRISQSAPDAFWEIVERASKANIGKPQKRAICYSIGQLIPHNLEKGIAVLKNLVGSPPTFSQDSGFLEYIINLIMGLIVYRNNTWAREQFTQLLSSPRSNAPGIMHAALFLQSLIDAKKLLSDSDKLAALAARDLLLEVITAVNSEIAELLSVTGESQELKESVKTLAQVIDSLASHLYYSSGIREESRQGEEGRLSLAEKRNYYNLIDPLLQHILEMQDQKSVFLPAHTAHSLMQLLNDMLPIYPREVLHYAFQVTLASKPFGYNLDALAIREVVKLIESTLADYRDEIKDEDSLSFLIGILDIFVNTGWPEALNLVWRLDEVFR